MSIIIETDLGHDPDDFFAICYLIAAGADIGAIAITPGSPDQIAIAKLIREECGLDFPVVSTKNRRDHSSGSVHHYMLKKYGYSLDGVPDLHISGFDRLIKCGDDLFVIGPPRWCRDYLSSLYIHSVTMQGGFLSYDLNPWKDSVQRLDKFEGRFAVPTFNMGGDPKGTKNVINANIVDKRFVGKNVCHTVLYDKNTFVKMQSPRCRAAELFMEAMGWYLDKQTHKAFHDPLAACLMLHPEIGRWVKGNPFCQKGEWGTLLDPNGADVLADIDRDKFWDCITTWS